MFEVTEGAARELKKALERNDVVAGSCFGLSVSREDGYELYIRPAIPKEDRDRIFTYDGRKVLLVDGPTASKLKETKLDIKESEGGETKLALFPSV